jgi:hypothetical protein
MTGNQYYQEPVEGRFYPKADVRGEVECWNWQASVSSRGYGLF